VSEDHDSLVQIGSPVRFERTYSPLNVMLALRGQGSFPHLWHRRRTSAEFADFELPVPPKYSESSVMIEVDQVLSAPAIRPSTTAYAAERAVLLV
jgi:hypothetical protein